MIPISDDSNLAEGVLDTVQPDIDLRVGRLLETHQLGRLVVTDSDVGVRHRGVLSTDSMVFDRLVT